MRTTSDPNDEDLSALLRGARPAPNLPPGFQQSVWKRIDREQTRPETPEVWFWMEPFLERLLQPRFALAGIAALLLVGGLTGLSTGTASARQQAQERYLSAVAPNSFR